METYVYFTYLKPSFRATCRLCCTPNGNPVLQGETAIPYIFSHSLHCHYMLTSSRLVHHGIGIILNFLTHLLVGTVAGHGVRYGLSGQPHRALLQYLHGYRGFLPRHMMYPFRPTPVLSTPRPWKANHILASVKD